MEGCGGSGRDDSSLPAGFSPSQPLSEAPVSSRSSRAGSLPRGAWNTIPTTIPELPAPLPPLRPWGWLMFVHSSEVFPSCRQLVPPSQGCLCRARGSSEQSGGPAVSWGGWLGVGAAKSCAGTCLALGGDSGTWGHQRGWTLRGSAASVSHNVLSLLTPPEPECPFCRVPVPAGDGAGVGSEGQ